MRNTRYWFIRGIAQIPTSPLFPVSLCEWFTQLLPILGEEGQHSHSCWSIPAGTWAPHEPRLKLSPPALLSTRQSWKWPSIFHKAVSHFDPYRLDNSASSHKILPWNNSGYRKALWMYLCCKVFFLRHQQKVLFKHCKSKSVLMKCRKELCFPP